MEALNCEKIGIFKIPSLLILWKDAFLHRNEPLVGSKITFCLQLSSYFEIFSEGSHAVENIYNRYFVKLYLKTEPIQSFFDETCRNMKKCINNL